MPFPLHALHRTLARAVVLALAIGDALMTPTSSTQSATTQIDLSAMKPGLAPEDFAFYRVVKGKREELKGAKDKVATSAWHTLELRAEGDRFTVSFDGKQLFTAQDSTFTGAGRVGLWTKADSVTYFDTIAITSLD